MNGDKWSESASFWEKHSEARRVMFDPATWALCKEAGVPETPPATTYDLLDVASGAGDVAIAIAERLGRKTRIRSMDIAKEMVAIVNGTAAQRELNVRARRGHAEKLLYKDDVFDAVVCRFGIMFFTDPLQAIREALRVLKPNGRVAHCVWGTREANPFFHAVQDILDRYVPVLAQDPDAPGAYRYALPGKLASIVRGAGAADIREIVFRFNMEAPLSFDQFFEMRTEMSDTLRDKLQQMPPDRRARFKEDVRDNSRQYFTPDGVRFPAEVRIVSGASSNR